MLKSKRLLFWIEIGLASITSILFLITLVWKDWIEIVFGVEPDRGSGELEWLIVGVLLVVSITLFVAARFEWRRVSMKAG